MVNEEQGISGDSVDPGKLFSSTFVKANHRQTESKHSLGYHASKKSIYTPQRTDLQEQSRNSENIH